MDGFIRTRALIGESAFDVLKNSRVALFGVGGVGGFAAEALARSGVGNITLVDGDVVSESNLNRQIIANITNIGESKTKVAKARILSINPLVNVTCKNIFYLPENAEDIPLKDFDYVIDAVDTVTAKIEIISRCYKLGVPVITCMGTAGKTDPTRLRVSAVENTSVCPLARVMRRELKKRGISGVKAVWSDELFEISQGAHSDGGNMSCEIMSENGLNERSIRKHTPPSMIFVPASAGILAAREAVFDIIRSTR